MLRRTTLALLLVLTPSDKVSAEFHGRPYDGGDLFADTWVATDGAGRSTPTPEECGPPKTGRSVGIFYWTWHRPTRGGPNDVTRILAEAKAARRHGRATTRPITGVNRN